VLTGIYSNHDDGLGCCLSNVITITFQCYMVKEVGTNHQCLYLTTTTLGGFGGWVLIHSVVAAGEVFIMGWLGYGWNNWGFSGLAARRLDNWRVAGNTGVGAVAFGLEQFGVGRWASAGTIEGGGYGWNDN